ncbi:MAG: hypothetical protein NTX24_01225 [Candidatus Pacearchaeota archaeon]|nr:hypothetical protein [Candidatus Pacearchaeota archaeon]
MCFKWYEEKSKRLGFIGVKAAKWSAFFLALMIAKLWPGILGLNWYWYLVIALVLIIIAMIKVFKK